ncbi:NUDIX domain-containing protein [Candidatus Woesearchaeota archaeon]|nr:MAG: NUDIX domain-containing protein [Candidatus Woesearchaeota archaeon]
MNLIKCAGGIVQNKNRVVLVQSHRYEYWGFPKGKIRKNETALQAAQREIYEETGLQKLHLVKKLGSYTRPTNSKNAIKKITLFSFYAEENKVQPLRKKKNDDVRNAKFFSFSQVPKKLGWQEDKDFFLKIKL